ncbi:MAG: putative periplasmic protein [Proteobacteria bacterium]|nr:putative periplasmic protein [Pseudomonadota bacterium]
MKQFFTLLLLSLALLVPAFAAEESAFLGHSKSLFLSVEETPSKVYVGQVFSIKLKAIVANDKIDGLGNTFSSATGVDVLNPQNPWERSRDNTYYNTFYFKINSKTAVMPRLSVSLVERQEALESEIITLNTPQLIQLKADPFFSNVIAQSLTINKHKTTTFDAKNVIIVLEIEATAANLKDFKLSGIAKSGIDSFSDNGTSQKIYYYAILPNYQKSFDFTYFDLGSNKFNKITLPMSIESDEVSTQLGLNPKESIFEFYKTVGYGILSFIFFIILLKRRKWYYFVLSLIFLALFFLDQNPLNNAKLKSNSTIMILPMERSTVFFTSDKILDIEKLGERDNYIKILLPDGKIGWTDRENIIKN